MKAIFDTRANSGYDDDAPERYHFPAKYLGAAERSVNDWIIYREPRRGGGRMGYVAVAFLDRIEADRVMQRHYFARLSNFLPFDDVVPLQNEEGFYENQLNIVPNSSRIGASLQGRSIRTISDVEFETIVRAGLDLTLSPENAVRLGLDERHADLELVRLLAGTPLQQQRRIVPILMNRKIRDAAFRRAVCDAYDNRCAVTGIQIINGGGNSEAQAAHIWSVGAGGPDVVQNGIALSGTVHWLFDRHLISLTDDYGLLVSHNRVPIELQTLFERQLERVHLPADKSLWPHLPYVQRHRESFLA